MKNQDGGSSPLWYEPIQGNVTKSKKTLQEDWGKKKGKGKY